MLVSLLALAGGLPGLAAGQRGEPAVANGVEPATLSFWNREIAVLRETYRERSPAARVEAALARLAALPEVGVVPTLRLDLVDGGSGRRALLRAGSDPLFGLGEGDLDPESSTTLERAGEAALARLREALTAREAQRQWPHLLRSLALAVAATALFALLAWGLLRLRRRALDRLHAALDRRLGRPSLSGFDFTQALLGLERFAVRGAGFALLSTLAYLWLAFVLSRFPFTQPWSTRLGTYLTELLSSLALGFVGTLPGVFTVAVIFLVTRAGAQLAAQFFDAVEQRRIEIGWLEPETVRATRRRADPGRLQRARRADHVAQLRSPARAAGARPARTLARRAGEPARRRLSGQPQISRREASEGASPVLRSSRCRWRGGPSATGRRRPSRHARPLRGCRS